MSRNTEYQQNIKWKGREKGDNNHWGIRKLWQYQGSGYLCMMMARIHPCMILTGIHPSTSTETDPNTADDVSVLALWKSLIRGCKFDCSRYTRIKDVVKVTRYSTWTWRIVEGNTLYQLLTCSDEKKKKREINNSRTRRPGCCHAL